MPFHYILGLGADVATLLGFPVLLVCIVILWGVYTGIQKMAEPERGFSAVWAGLSENRRRVLCVLFFLSILSYLIDISDRFGLLEAANRLIPLTKVEDKVFINQRVPLDGYAYHHCKFVNVTFVTNGGNTELVDNTLGGYQITSDESKISAAIETLNALGFLSVPFLNRDTGEIYVPFSKDKKPLDMDRHATGK